jgi:outer membrane scaffolding protein for murein synthesis (MipA/OmpV family)
MKLTGGIAAAALLAPLAALAQSAAPADYVLLGAGLRARPQYDGSDSQRADVIPVIRYYGQSLFARTTQGILEGGARVRLAQGWHAGAQLAYEAGREGLDWRVSAGLHVETDRAIGPMPLNLLARTRHALDSDRGVQADVRLTAGVYASGPLQAGVFTQATWASGKYVSTFYTSGSGGLLFTSLGALGSYDVARRWMALASVELRRLHDDAARSPITETRDNYYASVGLAYRR